MSTANAVDNKQQPKWLLITCSISPKGCKVAAANSGRINPNQRPASGQLLCLFHKHPHSLDGASTDMVFGRFDHALRAQ